MKATSEHLDISGQARVARCASVLLAMLVAACATNYPPAPPQADTANYEYIIGPLDTGISVCSSINDACTFMVIRDDLEQGYAKLGWVVASRDLANCRVPS